MRNRKKTRTARELEEKIVGKKRRISNGKEEETNGIGNKVELERNSNKKERKLEKCHLIHFDSLTLPLNNANDNIRKLRITEKDLPKQKSFELFLPGF
jgi:hypothetical protein